MLDSGVLCDQQINQGMEQGFSPFADIMDKLEETQLDRFSPMK
jgi:hypothetical protein